MDRERQSNLASLMATHSEDESYDFIVAADLSWENFSAIKDVQKSPLSQLFFPWLYAFPATLGEHRHPAANRSYTRTMSLRRTSTPEPGDTVCSGYPERDPVYRDLILRL